jgi:hypothetical protein
MKFIKALFVGMVMVVSADASPNFLDPHQSTTISMSIPAGKSVVSVSAVGEKYATLLTCTFDGGNGIYLKQEHAVLCWADIPDLVHSSTLSIKITNEADEKVQYAVSIGSSKK